MPYITDLDEIPFLAEFVKKHLNYKDYFFAAGRYPEVQIFTGRGCMARCNFCVYPQTMHGHKYRMRGLHKRFRWLCNARVNLDLETMKAMKAAGCHLIIPGIESGSQEILNNIHKGTKIEEVHRYAEDAKKAGLQVHACYMVGNKGETRETMNETLRLALELDTDTAQFYPLLPFPGTEAYNWAKSNGYIHGSYSDYVKEDGTINSLLELPGLSGEEMVKFCDYARKKYYMRPSYILRRLMMGLKDPSDLKRSIKAFRSLWKFLVK